MLHLLLADWLGLVTVSSLVLGTFGLGELLRHRARWASERTRKLAHIGCGIVLFFMPYLFNNVHMLGVLAAGFVLLLLSTQLLGFMQSVHAVRRNTAGVYYYPFAIYFSALLTWDQPVLFQLCVLLLAFADGLAALVGKRYGRHRYSLGGHYRTLEGSATVLGVSWVATTLLLGASGTTSLGAAALIGIVLAAVVCSVEALSLWGIDNLLIPLVSAVFLREAVLWTPGQVGWHVMACLVVAALMTACHYKGYLKLSGAVAAWLVGYITLGWGGVAWFVALFSAFMAVNLTGKLAERAVERRMPPGFDRGEEKGTRRDFMQIFANAGVCVLLCLVHIVARGAGAVGVAEMAFWAFIGSVCAASADSFASELGILSRKRPVLLWTLEPVPAGLSGGVTWLGYGAAALGALAPVLALMVVGSPYTVSVWTLVGAVGCGWFGSTVDSLVGATLQAKRQCVVCSRILERSNHCDVATREFRGIAWMGNDLVNVIGALAGAVAGLVLLGGVL